MKADKSNDWLTPQMVIAVIAVVVLYLIGAWVVLKF